MRKVLSPPHRALTICCNCGATSSTKSQPGRRVSTFGLNQIADFDRALAGALATNLVHFVGPGGINSLAADVLGEADWALVGGELLRQCAGLGELRDGISDPDACGFVARCSIRPARYRLRDPRAARY